MGEIKIFLILPALILLACLSGVNGQYQMSDQMAYQQSSQPYTMSTAPATATVSSGKTYDFTGVVIKVSEPNALYVDVTQSNTIALGRTDVILNQPPLPDLSYFKDKVLQFDITGHDILGRPVCDVYLNGRTIQDVYHCMKNPALCAYYGPYFNNQLIGTEAYSRQYYFWPYGSYRYYGYANPYWYGTGYYSSIGWY